MINNINTQDHTGKTPLMLATWSGDLTKIKELIKQGADLSILDNLGNSVLHFATRQKSTKVLETILSTNINIDLKSTEGYKQTALFTPAEVGNIPILQKLLERGANPNIEDKYKMTALQWAAQQGKVEAVKTLLKFDAQVNTQNNKGITPLMSATIKGILEPIQMLIEKGAELNAKAKDGYTALMYAAYYGHVDVVKYLLALNADKNIVSKKDETALSIAQKKKYNFIVDCLS